MNDTKPLHHTYHVNYAKMLVFISFLSRATGAQMVYNNYTGVTFFFTYVLTFVIFRITCGNIPHLQVTSMFATSKNIKYC